MSKKVLAVILNLMFVATTVVAAPIGLVGPTKDKAILGNFDEGKMLVGVGAFYDGVIERKMEDDEKVSFDVFGAELFMQYDDAVKLYATLGQVTNAEWKFFDTGDKYKLNFDDNLIFGVGLAWKFKLDVVDIIGDINYRQSTGIDLDSIDVNGVNVLSNITGADADWKEYSVSLGIAKDIGKFRPYMGVSYSDVEVDVEATFLGVSMSGDVDADKTFGGFAGVLFTPTEGIDINVQARFVNETAITASIGFKF